MGARNRVGIGLSYQESRRDLAAVDLTIAAMAAIGT
jgi:hypothetical protein